MITATVTITGKAGPGNTLTAAVFANVASIDFNPDKRIVTLNMADGTGPKIIAVSVTPTITITASANPWVVSVS